MFAQLVPALPTANRQKRMALVSKLSKLDKIVNPPLKTWSGLSGLSIQTPFCDKIVKVCVKIDNVLDKIVKVMVNGVPLNGIARSTRGWR